MRSSAQRGWLGLTGLVLVLAVLAALSARLGGPVSWQLTTGSSMLPGVTAGTLVVVHRQDAYEVGDVVSYRSQALRQIVLHRVIEVQEDGRLVMKGDNNDFRDPEQPRPADVLGKRVLQVSGVGAPLGFLKQPAVLGAGAALVALLLAVGTRARRRHRRPQGASDPSWAFLPGAAEVRGAQAAAAAGPAAWWGVLGCLSVVLLSSVGPFVQRTTADSTSHRTLSWTYEGDARPGLVYPGGEVRTGDVLYTRLVDEVDVTASLAMSLPQDAVVSGTWHLEVGVENGDGWETTAFRGPRTPVLAGAQALTTRLPVAELLALTRTVEAETGVGVGGVALAAKAVLDVTVRVDGETALVDETSVLSFDADESRVALDGTTTLVKTTGLAFGARDVDTRVGVGSLTLPQAGVRGPALAAATLLSVVLGVGRLRRREEDEDAQIRRSAGHLLVNADPAEDPEQVIDVDSFAALAQIAERYERVLMCGDHAGIPFYFVLDDGIAYRYYTQRAADLLDAQEAGEGPSADDPASSSRSDVDHAVRVPAQRGCTEDDDLDARLLEAAAPR